MKLVKLDRYSTEKRKPILHNYEFFAEGLVRKERTAFLLNNIFIMILYHETMCVIILALQNQYLGGLTKMAHSQYNVTRGSSVILSL